MSYSVGDVRRWEVAALAGAADAVNSRVKVAAEARRGLVSGGEGLDEGWDGRAADAVLDAVESEKAHVTRLADGLEDLADALARAHAVLGPAVQTVRDRISEAEAAGLVVTDVSVEPAAGYRASGTGTAVEQATVDLHAEAIGAALVTVRSLDEHYGREIDDITARLHSAIPPEVDRSPIQGPDDPWPGRGVDAITAAMSEGYPARADELDPRTRGRHTLNPAPDDFGRAASSGLRWVGRFAGAAGGGLTVYDGVRAHAEGKTSTREAVIETGSALTGGMAGGFAAGAAAGSFFGPVGTFIGAGIGAAVGTYLGQRAGDAVHEELFDERTER